MSGENPAETNDPQPFSCRTVNENTNLQSPKHDALETVSEGDLLRLEVDGRSVIATTEEKQLVGSIGEVWTPDLIDCIEQGYSYEAKVLVIRGGFCRVRVRNRSR